MESDEWPLTILVEYYDTRCAARAKAVLEDMYNKVSTTFQVADDCSLLNIDILQTFTLLW